ncbi:hypothetical protein, partial [Salmonella enterica]|uniref:hypothetical protein n=1 Tax=Salmonella enterica TaxID=28901 RepID=UPI0020C305A8
MMTTASFAIHDEQFLEGRLKNCKVESNGNRSGRSRVLAMLAKEVVMNKLMIGVVGGALMLT